MNGKIHDYLSEIGARGGSRMTPRKLAAITINAAKAREAKARLVPKASKRLRKPKIKDAKKEEKVLTLKAA